MSDTNKNIKIAAAISCAVINFRPYASINNEYTATDIVNHLDSISSQSTKNQTRIILADLEGAFNSNHTRKYTKSLLQNQVAFDRRGNSKGYIYKIKFTYLNTDSYSERSLKSLILENCFTVIESQAEEKNDTENQEEEEKTGKF